MMMSDNDDIDNDDGKHHTGMCINVAMCVRRASTWTQSL